MLRVYPTNNLTCGMILNINLNRRNEKKQMICDYQRSIFETNFKLFWHMNGYGNFLSFEKIKVRIQYIIKCSNLRNLWRGKKKKYCKG